MGPTYFEESSWRTARVTSTGVSYLADRYAEILTKYDVQTLFGSLEHFYGNLSAASDALGIQRKTVYDWEKNSEDVRISTKRKILDASLKCHLERTILFLLEKMGGDLNELLERHVSLTYRKIMQSSQPGELSRHLDAFRDLLDKHGTTLFESDEERMNHLIDEINKRAITFNLHPIERSIKNIPSESLAEKFSELLEIMRDKKLSRSEIIASFGLPPHFAESVCNIYGYIGPQVVSFGDYNRPQPESLSSVPLLDVMKGKYR
jgi:transcriptional regulator with XRE-family HTH domain